MIAPPIEPLEPELWFEQVRTIGARISRLEGEAPDAVIRKAFYLVQLTPAPLRDVVVCRTDEAAFEEMLDCGAYDAAVTALMPPPVGYEIARETGKDRVTATVHLPDGAGAGTASDETIALALLAAWSRCLDALYASAAIDLNLDRGPRRGRPVRPPRSSRH